MAVIVKTDIVAAVDAHLQTNFATADPNGLDRAIIAVLMDMSNRALLVGTDATQTLADGDTTLAYPTGFRSVINITLIDGSGAEKAPLKKLPRGHQEYRELRHNDNSSGITKWYSEFNKKFWLWRPADRAYTTLIEYRKNHAKDVNNIEFETEFENLMFVGATYHHALAKGRTKAIGIWGPVYFGELKFAMLNRNTQPSVVRG